MVEKINETKIPFFGGASGTKPACQCQRCQRHRFYPWVTEIPWRRAWQLTPLLLPGESHGQRSLAGYGSQDRKELDKTVGLHSTHGSDGKEFCLQCRRSRFDLWIGKIRWRREWQPIPVFLPGEFHEQKSLMGYSLYGPKESETTG